ncbi:MAG TPA: hypothetical protein DEP87_00465 [Candidatus Pacebacteria bacterium]|nr:hypothetical protein [Candidatus Paceibacterota bacterium]
MMDNSSHTDAKQAEIERRNREERDFHQAGETYRSQVLPVETILKQLESEQGVGDVIKRSIKSLGQEIVNQPDLLAAAISYPANSKQKELSAEQTQEALKKLRSFLDASPITHFLRTKADSEKKYELLCTELINRISRYARAIKRADKVNGDKPFLAKDGTGKQRENAGRSGQVTYNFDHFLDLSAEEILKHLTDSLPPGIQFDDLKKLISQTQVELIAGLDDQTRYYALLNWVVQTARKVRAENLKIFDTPDTQKLLTRLEMVAEQKNGLGGAILYGPPGTGKTELLVEKNRRRGFDSRVISIHHFSDYVQLMGEKPVPIGMDKSASNVEKLAKVKDTLQAMNTAQAFEFVSSKFSESAPAWETFLELAQAKNVAIGSATEITEATAKTIIDQLINKLTKDIVYIGLGVKDGLNEEMAWARGEIIQAFEHGQLPILDEMDKGSAHSLEGISRLLNLSPGQKIMLGDEEYTIPTWAHIDGTANAMNLAPFLHDRFAPNVIYVDYPSPQDTLLKSLVWLADDQGLLDITMDKQEKFVGLALYVFPEIQKLYPDVIEHPLSNRGIRKFCQMIAHGHSVSSALNELLLKPGALTDNPKGLEAIQGILDRFGNLTSPNIALEPAKAEAKKSDIINSPIYAALTEYYQPFDATKGNLDTVRLKGEQREKLLAQVVSATENSGTILDTQVGTTIGLEASNDKTSVAVRLNGKVLTRAVGVSGNSSEASLNQEARLISADNLGRLALVRTNNTVLLVDLVTNKSKAFISSQEQSQCVLTGDGGFVVELIGNKLALHPVAEALKNDAATDAKPVGFFDENGDEIKCSCRNLSADGKFLQIETVTKQTYLIDLFALRSGQKHITLNRPFIDETGWKISSGNSLVHPDKNLAYLLKT